MADDLVLLIAGIVGVAIGAAVIYLGVVAPSFTAPANDNPMLRNHEQIFYIRDERGRMKGMVIDREVR